MSRIVKLPAGYRQVDYIESVGGQYVDTEFVPTANTRIECEFSRMNTTAQYSGVYISGSYLAFGGGTNIELYYGNKYVSAAFPTGRTTIVIDGVSKTASVNGTSYTFSSPTYTAGTNSLIIFALKRSATNIADYCYMRLYGYRVYDNGVLVRDYIPCKTTDNVGGLYDLVEGKFYGNAGTGAFLYGAPVKLPKGYRRLTYIQSSGTQYVDTGINYTAANYNTLRFVLKNYYPSLSSSYWLVNGCSGGGGIFYFGCSSGGGEVYYGNGSNVNTGKTAAAGVVNDWDYDAKNGTYKLNGTTLASGISFTAPSGALPLALFGYHTSDTSVDKHTERIYSCQIYDNGTLTRDYVPCITDGGVVGLYDDLNGVFYGNAGTGAFIAGKKIYTEDDITKLEYVESTGAQYVDTEFKHNQNTRTVMDVQATSMTENVWLFEGRGTGGVDAKGVFFYYSSSKLWTCDYGTASSRLSFSGISATDRLHIDYNKNVCTINGQSVTHTASTFQSTYNLCLLADNNAGTVKSFAKAKLYSCQIYDNGTPVRDYYPATADGEVGLWDACTGVLYTSASDTALIAGPEIKYTPDTPSDFAISEITDSSVTLAWPGVEDALGYRVYRNALLRAELTETVFTDDITPFEYTGFAVTAFNDLGESDPARLEVNYFPENPVLHLITDRTYADVTRADYLNALWVGGIFTGTTEELAEWFGIVKGAYNAHDFNRVGAALRYVANRMSAQGYIASASVKTDWIAADTPTPAQTADYLAAVRNLRGVIAVLPTTPTVPNDTEDFNHGEANAIEQILVDLDMLLTNISLAWVYSGEIYSGEV